MVSVFFMVMNSLFWRSVMWRPGNAALSRLEKHNRVARPTESARRPGRKFSRGGGLELQSGYALPPFQAAAFPRLILICMDASRNARTDSGETDRQIAALYSAYWCELSSRWP